MPVLASFIRLQFTPQVFLGLIALLSVGSAVVWGMIKLAQGRGIAAVARQFDLRYTVLDRFDLSRRVAPLVPVIGAADVHAQHVCYGLRPLGPDQSEQRVYVITVAYTIGTLSRPLQRSGVIAAREHPQTGRLSLAIPRLFPSGPDSYRQCMEQLSAPPGRPA
jgi:hypothetical protein